MKKAKKKTGPAKPTKVAKAAPVAAKRTKEKDVKEIKETKVLVAREMELDMDDSAAEGIEAGEMEATGGEEGAGAEGLATAKMGAPGAVEASTGSLKNFRHHPDMENFYRFIYENDLRFEALAIIEEILSEKQARRALKTAAVTKTAKPN